MKTIVKLNDPDKFYSSNAESQLSFLIFLLWKENIEDNVIFFTEKEIQEAAESVNFDYNDLWGESIMECAEDYPEKFKIEEDAEGVRRITTYGIEASKTPIKAEDLDPAEVQAVHDMLRKAVTDIGDPTTGCVKLTEVGSYRRLKNVEMPKGVQKITPFLKLFPDIYEIQSVNDTPESYTVKGMELPKDRKVKEHTAPTAPITKPWKGQQPVQPLSQSDYYSPYRLFDNIAIDNLQQRLMELTQLSDDESLMVMEDQNDPNPYEMVQKLLELNYCRAVKRTAACGSQELTYTPLEMWFDTGLRAAADHNKHIRMHAVYNTAATKVTWTFSNYEI